MRVAAAISPSATSPADTEPRNIVARPVDSAIVAARAPWRVKCSVVTNVTAAGRGSVPSSGAGFASLIIAHHLACDGYGAIIAGKHQASGRRRDAVASHALTPRTPGGNDGGRYCVDDSTVTSPATGEADPEQIGQRRRLI